MTLSTRAPGRSACCRDSAACSQFSPQVEQSWVQFSGVMVAHSWGFLRFNDMLVLLYANGAGSQPPDAVRKSLIPHSTTHASARVALASGAKLVPRPVSSPFS